MKQKLTITKSSKTPTHQHLGTSKRESVETLVALGLTCKQARVYLALLNTGYAEAKAITQERNQT